MNPALITAGGSILGGILGKGSAPKASDTWRHTMMGIRAQAEGSREFGEKYGINPMALLGVSQPLQSTYSQDNSMMGQGIANAALAIADGINAKSAQAAYVEKLEEQNSDLRRALDTNVLRAPVPGIFGGQASVPGISGGPIDPEPTPIAAPYIARNEEVLAIREGVDAEDVLTAVPLDALANLQKEGTLDNDFIDRLFRNAEDATTAVLRPVAKGLKSTAGYIAGRYMDGPERSLKAYTDRLYGPGEWGMDDYGVPFRK